METVLAGTFVNVTVHVRYQVPRYSGWKHVGLPVLSGTWQAVRYQVPRYSGWKLAAQGQPGEPVPEVRYQVPRYSGWKLSSIKKRAVGTAGQIPSTAIQRMETVALLQNILAHLRGWKPSTAIQRMETACDHKHVHAGPQVGNQVPGYSK